MEDVGRLALGRFLLSLPLLKEIVLPKVNDWSVTTDVVVQGHL